MCAYIWYVCMLEYIICIYSIHIYLHTLFIYRHIDTAENSRYTCTEYAYTTSIPDVCIHMYTYACCVYLLYISLSYM